jgi:hypothetical protein
VDRLGQASKTTHSVSFHDMRMGRPQTRHVHATVLITGERNTHNTIVKCSNKLAEIPSRYIALVCETRRYLPSYPLLITTSSSRPLSILLKPYKTSMCGTNDLTSLWWMPMFSEFMSLRLRERKTLLINYVASSYAKIRNTYNL